MDQWFFERGNKQTESETMPTQPCFELDLAAVDKEDRFVLVGEAKARTIGDQDHVRMGHILEGLAEAAPFVLFADPATIQLFHWDGQRLSGPAATLSTREVLQHYDPEFANRKMFEFYLVSLLEAWLRDLAYRWKSESPPGIDEIKRIGLLERLEGGTTSLQRGVRRWPTA
jgi:hypothetical protein